MKVLVLHASALHIGFLGCYGNTWIATPHLDRLAAEGIVFDLHYADNPAQRTCWTGRADPAPNLGAPLIADLLQAQGCYFAHVTAEKMGADAEATPLERTLEAAVEALERLAHQPRWLCWVDLPSLHPPWNVSDEFTRPYLAEESGASEDEGDEPFEPLLEPAIGPLDPIDLVLWERLRCTYAGAVTYLDAGLGLLLEELKQRNLYDELAVIFTSDRGLALGEHGIVGDFRPWLHDEVVHIPLIIRPSPLCPQGCGISGSADAGLRMMALTQPVDLAATLLDLFGVAAVPMDGMSLLPLLTGQALVLREHSICQWKLAGEEEWALRRLDCALIVPADQAKRPVQFYLKPEDRWEMNNVIQHRWELAEELQSRLQSRQGQLSSP